MLVSRGQNVCFFTVLLSGKVLTLPRWKLFYPSKTKSLNVNKGKIYEYI